MKKVKQKVYNLAREFAETKEPFSVEDVLANLENDCTATYVANRLYELSIGSFPIIRRTTNTTISLTDAEYISAKVKEPKKKKLEPGMDKDTFHAHYGCFGAVEVVKGGRCLYSKSEVNKIRLKVSTYLNTHQPNRAKLTQWLRNFGKQNSQFFRKQSIQIGIIQALQNNYENPQNIYGILGDAGLRSISRGRKYEDIILRENAANNRQNATK